MMNNKDMFFHGIHYLWWIAGVALVILIIFFIGRDNSYLQDKPRSVESSLKILENRFVRGEITKQEFEQAKRFLKVKTNHYESS